MFNPIISNKKPTSIVVGYHLNTNFYESFKKHFSFDCNIECHGDILCLFQSGKYSTRNDG